VLLPYVHVNMPCRNLVFVITFEKLSPAGPKNGVESCVSRFSTICAKNQVLKLKIDKVTVIRATNSSKRLCLFQVSTSYQSPFNVLEYGEYGRVHDSDGRSLHGSLMG
jgi:hypothetical protein